MKTLAEIMRGLESLPQRSKKEVEQYCWKNDILPRLQNSGLPQRFCARKPLSRQQRKTLDRLRAICCKAGAVVALVGPRGTGKTTIAAQMILSRAENDTLAPWDRQPPYRKLTDLVKKFKPLYADFGSTEIESLSAARDFYVDVTLHVIDEIHECDDMKMKDRVLTDLVDRCYSAFRDVILISNQTAEEFQTTTSDSILSRLSEHGEIIECDWKSFREK